MNKQITLEITAKEDYVSASSFLKAVQQVVSMLAAIDRNMSGEGQEPSKWQVVGLEMHSPPQITFAGTAAVVDAALDGIFQINTEARRPRKRRSRTRYRSKGLRSTL